MSRADSLTVNQQTPHQTSVTQITDGLTDIDEIFQITGSEIMTTDIFFQKFTFPAEANQSTVRSRRPSS